MCVRCECMCECAACGAVAAQNGLWVLRGCRPYCAAAVTSGIKVFECVSVEWPWMRVPVCV